ncbi:ComEC/Rec2 family competence protein [Cupidesulfovibrio sp. SRB-5]|nr:ComEC/Rec2 family competence protein [Nitratidesulfovibrio sp. SRB-5]
MHQPSSQPQPRPEPPLAPPLLPPLLFRQACLLAALAGLAALPPRGEPVWAVTAATLLWLGMGARARGAARVAVYALCFCVGLGAAWLREPGPPPPTPAWADTDRPVRFSGTVAECTPTTDGRIRLLLRDVRPETNARQANGAGGPAAPFGSAATASAAASGATPGATPDDTPGALLPVTESPAPTEPMEHPALPGLLALSWQSPPLRPAPGTRLTVTAAVAPMRGLANPGGDDSAAFWASRDVRFRAWTTHAKGMPRVEGTPSAGWSFRENLRTAMLRAIALHGAPENGRSDAAAGPDAKNGDATTAAATETPAKKGTGAKLRRKATAEASGAGAPVSGTFPSGGPKQEPSGQGASGQEPFGPGAPAPESAAAAEPGHAPEPPTPAGAFLPALVLGDRFHLDSRDLDLVARASLIHAIALSGMHLCAAAALGAAVALLAGRMAPGVYLRIPRRKLALACSLPPALAYVWLGGAPPSLVRAALMLVFWSWLYWRGRPQVLLDGLLWAVCVIVLFDPGAADDLSLQLSACAVAGIALARPLAALLPRRLRELGGLGGVGEQDGLAERGGAASHDGYGGPTATAPAHRMHRRTAHPWRSRLMVYAARTLWVTLCIQLILLPLSARVFGTSSPWFALNLLFLPLIDGVALPLGLAGMAMAPAAPEVAGWLLLVARWPFDLLLVSLRWLDGAGLLGNPQLLRPHPAAMLGLWVLLGAAVLHVSERVSDQTSGGATGQATGSTRRRAALLLAAGALLMLGPVWPRLAAATDPAVRLAVLDVGQGQSVALDWGAGRMLVDGGGTASRSWDTGRRVVAPALTDNRPPRLDAVVWSHPDRDHLRGLLYVIDAFAVRRVAGNGEPPHGEDGARLAAILRHARLVGHHEERWHAGQRIPLADGLELEVLHPPLPEAAGPAFDGNDASLVLRLTARDDSNRQDGPNRPDGLNGPDGPNGQGGPNGQDGRGRRRGLALIPGDAGDPAIRALLDAGTDLSAEVLVLPHHGGRRKLLPQLLDAVRPSVALASAGYRNRWGFPVADTRAALAARNIPLLVTAESGQIQARWDARGTKDAEKARDMAETRVWPGPATVTTARDGDGGDADGGQ